MFDPSLLPHNQPSPVSDNRANISDVITNDIPSLSLSDDLDDDGSVLSEGDRTFQSLLNNLSQGKLTFSFIIDKMFKLYE